MAREESYIDWTGCELVERVPGKVSGRPVIRGTRIFADTIVQDAKLGSSLEEIHENFPELALATIRHLISFARRTTLKGCLNETEGSELLAKTRQIRAHWR